LGPTFGNEIKSDFFAPSIRFGVISDTHFYDPGLGMAGQAFEEAMTKEIKLFRYSRELLQTALLEIESAKVDFLIIPGDLTKDGELASHLALAGYLDELRSKGIPTFVVPGNHDINNPEAFSYSGAKPESTETITPWEFVHIYNKFGYTDALFKDNYSLSKWLNLPPGSGSWPLTRAAIWKILKKQ
jgi:metallophosphoesterase superfamily enzyme